MAKESILRIAEAEQRAEETERLARNEYDTMLKEAQLAADEIVKAAELEAKEIIKSAKKKAQQMIAKSEFQTERDSKTASLRNQVNTNYEKAVDMIIEALAD